MIKSKKKLIWSWIMIGLSILPLILSFFITINAQQMLDEIEGIAALIVSLFGALFLVVGLICCLITIAFNLISLLLISLTILKDGRKEVATFIPFNVSIALIVIPFILMIVSLV